MNRTSISPMRYVIPPFIRGLTFDGIKGLFISRTEEKPHMHVLELQYDDCADMDSVFARIKEQFVGFVAQQNRYPDGIRLPSREFYGIGATYGEAISASGCTVRPDDIGSFARGDVVRGKIALVTGGAQGIGEGLVSKLTDSGAFVFIADLNIKKAAALADQLNKHAGHTTATALEADVTSEDSIDSMLHEVTQITGGLDIFISNAGVLKAGSVKEMSLKDFSFVTAVDYTGFFICAKHAARILSLQHLGAPEYLTDIIVISSKSGLEGSNKNGAYAGAKFGVIGLTQSYALELASDGIKVNALCPGNFLDGPLWSDPKEGLFVQYLKAEKVPGAKEIADVRRFYEGRVPLRRGCTVDDLIKAVYYCIEQQYETGQAVPITGGQVMLN